MAKKNVQSELSLEKLLQDLGKFEIGKAQQQFITHIRFPNFKNIQRGARVDFKHPITALVGVNGSGKSSVMQALFGAPLYQSVSDFWFSTALDPIQAARSDPPRFIFGHWNTDLKKAVETRKALVPKRRSTKAGTYADVDYWEPTKEVATDGMEMGHAGKGPIAGRSKDRWNPPPMKVFYTNFRNETSAFDKYLYFGSLKETKSLKTKQDRLRAWSDKLLPFLSQDGGILKVRTDRPNVLYENSLLTSDELAYVSYILDKEYASARFMEHSLYGGQRGVGIYFKNKQGTSYSEAFAGSGEMAVASLVTRLTREAKEPSLVLLDEPEVSLHPGAQSRLLAFLMGQVRERKHQVVFSTHSPALIRGLPAKAIVLFAQVKDGRFGVAQDVEAKTVFGHIGEPLKEKINVYVEDPLARRLVAWVLKEKFGAIEQARFNITFDPGGVQTYFGIRVPTWMMATDPDPLHLLLDGDQKPAVALPDPGKVTPDDLRAQIDELIKGVTKLDKLNFGADGGNDPNAPEKLYLLKVRYLKYCREHVDYLPRSSPEEIILAALGLMAPKNSHDAKEALRAHLENLNLPTTSDEGDNAAFTLFVANQVAKPSDDVAPIEALLRRYLEAAH